MSVATPILTRAEHDVLSDALQAYRESAEEEAGLDPDGPFAGYLEALDSLEAKLAVLPVSS